MEDLKNATDHYVTYGTVFWLDFGSFCDDLKLKKEYFELKN